MIGRLLCWFGIHEGPWMIASSTRDADYWVRTCTRCNRDIGNR